MKETILLVFLIFGVVAIIANSKEEFIKDKLTKPNYASPEMMQILDNYSGKPRPVIKNGLYKSAITVNTGRFFNNKILITTSIFIDDNKITTELNIPKNDISARLTTNYHYDGSVWRYNNMQGSIGVAHQEGTAIQAYGEGFALVGGTCELLEEYEVTGDYLCKDNISFIIFKPA